MGESMSINDSARNERKLLASRIVMPIVRSIVGVLPFFVILISPLSQKGDLSLMRGFKFHVGYLAYGLSLGVAESIIQSMPRRARHFAFLIYAIFGLSIIPSMLVAGGTYSVPNWPLLILGGALFTGTVGISRSFRLKTVNGWLLDVLFALVPFLLTGNFNLGILFIAVFLSFLMFCQRVKGGIPSE